LKTRYYILLILSFSLYAQVQDTIPVKAPQEIVYDLTSEKDLKEFDAQRIQEFKTQDSFNYTLLEENENFWTRFKKWLGQLWSKFYEWVFGIDEVTGAFAVLLRLIPYLIIISVLFFLGWLFMKVSPSNMLLEKQQLPQVILNKDEDIMKNQDIRQLIEQALKENNYRLAIRYYYLLTLKKLSDNDLIVWESQKTNTDYTKEITDDAIKKQFQNITRLYDFIWYGSFEVNERSFYQAQQKFESLTNSIPI